MVVILRALPLAFFARSTLEVAPALVGKVLVRRAPGQPQRMARLVEVEAYLGAGDAASHARRGPTKRSSTMFGPPGRLYVYLVYGLHHCVNVVCESEGVAGAVLLRAAEPLAGFAPGVRRLLSGPGKLAAGFGITRSHDGTVLRRAPDALYLADDGAPAPPLACSSRIGVDFAGDGAAAPLRFYWPAHPDVSGPRTRRG